jgi:hypothetical protein
MTDQKLVADVTLKLDDKSLFGNDAGEDEDEDVLASYFVNQAAFKDFLDPATRLQVVRARKGMGKSALLAMLMHDLKRAQNKPLIVHVVPATLTGMLEPPSAASSSALENYWKQVVCRAINFEIAKNIGFAWRDDQITLVESAEMSGFRGRNIVGALISRLLGKVNLMGAIEVAYSPSGIKNAAQLLKRIQGEAAGTRDVWFMLDDIDTKFQNTPEQQAYVSSFFSACRMLVKDIQGIYIRATVRTDVWTSLRSAEDLDKFEQYVCDIRWTTAQQKAILVKRIYAYVIRNNGRSRVAKNWSIDNQADNFIEIAFDSRIKWGEIKVPPIQVLRVFSGSRPRWMAQLCRLAGVKAVYNRKSRIGSEEINEVMVDFGARRLSDIYKEHSHQFVDLQKVVEVFSSGKRRYTTTELARRLTDSYIKNKSANSIPDIDGVPYRDSWQIAHFLFKCGFLVGHNQREISIDAPEFVSYDQRPDLLQVSTNLDDHMMWEIQAPYRRALQIR